MVMRTGSVLTCCDDGEVRDLMALLDDQCRQMCRYLRLGSADERNLAGLESSCDPIDGRSCGAECRDLGGILAHAQTPDDIDRTRVLHAGQHREQFDEKPCPHLITHCDVRRLVPTDDVGSDSDGVLGLLPCDDVEDGWQQVHSRCLESRNDECRPSFEGNDQHRQSLERHRLVADEVRHVEADRYEYDIDPMSNHGFAQTIDSVDMDCFIDSESRHAETLPADVTRLMDAAPVRRERTPLPSSRGNSIE
jgi:hypothetical protein